MNINSISCNFNKLPMEVIDKYMPLQDLMAVCSKFRERFFLALNNHPTTVGKVGPNCIMDASPLLRKKIDLLPINNNYESNLKELEGINKENASELSQLKEFIDKTQVKPHWNMAVQILFPLALNDLCGKYKVALNNMCYLSESAVEACMQLNDLSSLVHGNSDALQNHLMKCKSSIAQVESNIWHNSNLIERHNTDREIIQEEISGIDKKLKTLKYKYKDLLRYDQLINDGEIDDKTIQEIIYDLCGGKEAFLNIPVLYLDFHNTDIWTINASSYIDYIEKLKPGCAVMRGISPDGQLFLAIRTKDSFVNSSLSAPRIQVFQQMTPIEPSNWVLSGGSFDLLNQWGKLDDLMGDILALKRDYFSRYNASLPGEEAIKSIVEDEKKGPLYGALRQLLTTGSVNISPKRSIVKTELAPQN